MFRSGLTLAKVTNIKDEQNLNRVNISDLRTWCETKFEHLIRTEENTESTSEHHDSHTQNVTHSFCFDTLSYSSNPLFYAKHLYINGEEVTNLVIPEGTSKISAIAFVGYEALQSVLIPTSVTTVGRQAFSKCNNLHYYPFLAFTFKGRIKSLIRAEEKFNGYILEYIYDYYKAYGKYPNEAEIKNNLNFFRDLIAYRIVISLPQCHVSEQDKRVERELKYLYEIANVIPDFLEERGFTAELSGLIDINGSKFLTENNLPYYRDYVQNPRSSGYRSLHITFYDNFARCYTELQLRTKDMDDLAEIGRANHIGYEKQQEENRAKRDIIPEGKCKIFDEAYERLIKLQELDLAAVNVNMFMAYNNQLINDGCGLFRGRQILPFEHLSRFQNDM